MIKYFGRKMSDLSPSSSTTMSSFGRSSIQHSLSDSALDILSARKSSHGCLFEESQYERLATDLRIMFKNFTRDQDRKLLLMLDILTEMREQNKERIELSDTKFEELEQVIRNMEDGRKEKKFVQSIEKRMDVVERMTLAVSSELRKMKRKSMLESSAYKTMGTDDSMSDDVFEDDTLRAPAQRNAPSPTGYRDYQPPADTPSRLLHDDDMPLHKTILLGDSGVGKTSLLVQFETGKFQSGNFSATVGIGFTLELTAGVDPVITLPSRLAGCFYVHDLVHTV